MTSGAAVSTVMSVDRSGTPRERKVSAYDFRRPNKVSRDHVRALQLVHETFARQFSTILSSTLRTLSPVTIKSIEQQTYDEYISGMPSTTYLALLAVDPLPGQGIFHLPLSAGMEIVDRLLGGPGGGGHPDRPLTEIEIGVLRGMLERILRELTYAFESFMTVDTRITSQESNPQFAQVVGLSDMVVVATYQLGIAELQWEITLCFPFQMLQPALDAFSDSKKSHATDDEELNRAQEMLHDHLHNAPMDVAVQFNSVALAAQDIVGLRPGDVLPLRHRVSEPLTVSVGGVPCFSAMPGMQGRRLAAMVVPSSDELRQQVDEDPDGAGLAAALPDGIGAHAAAWDAGDHGTAVHHDAGGFQSHLPEQAHQMAAYDPDDFDSPDTPVMPTTQHFEEPQ